MFPRLFPLLHCRISILDSVLTFSQGKLLFKKSNKIRTKLLRKPASVVKSAPVAKPIPAFKPVPAAKPVPVAKPAPIPKPVTVSKPLAIPAVPYNPPPILSSAAGLMKPPKRPSPSESAASPRPTKMVKLSIPGHKLEKFDFSKSRSTPVTSLSVSRPSPGPQLNKKPSSSTSGSVTSKSMSTSPALGNFTVTASVMPSVTAQKIRVPLPDGARKPLPSASPASAAASPVAKRPSLKLKFSFGKKAMPGGPGSSPSPSASGSGPT